jgi:hypothetical protein
MGAFFILLFVVPVIAFLFGSITASIARGKGRSFETWWVYGALLFIIALPHALLLQDYRSQPEAKQAPGPHRKCPFCGAQISGTIKRCPECHEEWD